VDTIGRCTILAGPAMLVMPCFLRVVGVVVAIVEEER